MDLTKVPSPCYVMEEDLLRKNLSLIKSVADRALLCGSHSLYSASI